MPNEIPHRNESDSDAHKSLAISASPNLPNQMTNTDQTFFPGYVPITDQFGNDPSVPPPDHILDERWWKTTGQQLHREAVRKAIAKHRNNQIEYQALLASVEHTNKRIDVLNGRLRR